MSALEDPLVGSSEAMRTFRDLLAQAARSDATVLFQGESGCGKGLAARALHEGSARAAGPFVVASLAALSPTLIESTLFGHERGAFTDAHRARKGLFRQAQGGTIVLDDVDLLPSAEQVKLLRTIQERVVEPLGAEAPVPIDVRVCATTNAELMEEVEKGEFRQDLYYRLAVVMLHVPPLRVRLEDLSELAGALTARVAKRSGVAPRELSAAALERLRAHSWPGNVRELENALERVLVLGESAGEDGLASVQPEEFDFLEEARAGVAGEIARAALSQGLTVDAMTHAMMEEALAEHRGNVSAAARQVGLTRRAFDYRRGRTGKEREE